MVYLKMDKFNVYFYNIRVKARPRQYLFLFLLKNWRFISGGAPTKYVE